MKKIVLTGIGKDRPGIVSEVTRALYQKRCNVEDSSMTILEGEFAMILIVSLPDQVPLASFKKQFQSLQKRLGVSLVARELKEKPTIGPEIHQGQPHIISVLGKDRPGIVYHVSQLLAAHGVNITDVNTKVIGREGGRNLYAMVLEIEIPSPRAQSQVEAELKALGKRLKLDVNLRAIESLKL